MTRFGAMLEELVKAADAVTGSEAMDAMRRLRDLEAAKPTAGHLLRGAGVGAIAGPVASAASRFVAGGAKRGALGAARDIAGQAASGAIYGGAIPFARHHLETGVQKQKLKEYLGHKPKGRLRGQIKKTLGV